MNEVEIIGEINKLQVQKQTADADTQRVIDEKIAELMEQLQPVEKSRDQKAFLDECAG